MSNSDKHSFAALLSSFQRSALKGLAHSIKPVVLVGRQGISNAIISEIKLALDKHELIKIQLAKQLNSVDAKKEDQEKLAQILPEHSHIVSCIGRIVILYQEKKPDEAKIKLKNLK